MIVVSTEFVSYSRLVQMISADRQQSGHTLQCPASTSERLTVAVSSGRASLEGLTVDVGYHIMNGS